MYDMLLYHGSDVAIERPLAELNVGFADLGQGFYCTDNYDVAVSRAQSRARKRGTGEGVVSTFQFEEDCLPWVTVGETLEVPDDLAPVFGLRFELSRAGLAAWATYIGQCRKGHTAVEGLGEPTVVRAWIANEIVEMICSGLVDAKEFAEFIDLDELVVQYCFRSQEFLDAYVHAA